MANLGRPPQVFIPLAVDDIGSEVRNHSNSQAWTRAEVQAGVREIMFQIVSRAHFHPPATKEEAAWNRELLWR